MHGKNRALAGAVTGVAIVGSGLLAAGLRARLGAPRSGSPASGARSWLAGTLLGTATPSPGTAVVVAVVVLVGVVAGLACRRRILPGLVVLAVAGAVGAWIVLLPGAAPSVLVVPLAATIGGMAALTALLLRRRRAPAPAAGPGLSRRRLLVTGAVVVAGTVAGLATSWRRPREIVLREASGPPRLESRPVVDVRALGAAGDGRTDDGDAIRRGMDQVNRDGGTLFFPAGTYYYRATGPLRPAEGVTIAGAPGASTIAYDSPAADDFVDFCVVNAADVTLDGLIVRRVGEFPAVLLNLGGAASGFSFTRGALVGGTDAMPGADCHGIKFPDDGTTGGIGLADSTFATLTYGLLQANASTAVVDGVRVDRCSFIGNANTDLEFNSPYGSIRAIHVEGCAFSDNDSAGFGVGLAHVAGAEVVRNTFERYSLEAVHIEDYSTDVVVRDNTFTDCGLRDHSHVQIISGSERVDVVGNTFHATGNANRIYVVNALPGGDRPTAGGRPPAPPTGVAVERNTFDCAEPAVPVYFQGVRDGVIRGNTITATGDPFRLLDDPGTEIEDNTVNGQR